MNCKQLIIKTLLPKNKLSKVTENDHKASQTTLHHCTYVDYCRVAIRNVMMINQNKINMIYFQISQM